MRPNASLACAFYEIGLFTPRSERFKAGAPVPGAAEVLSDNAVTAAFVGAMGWLCAYILNIYKDDRIQKTKLTIDHTAEQIRDFYGPLVSLTDQLDSLASVIHLISFNNNNPGITTTFYNKFFLPVHKEINRILSTKIHLLEGSEIPDSFKLYFEHYAAEHSVHELNSSGISLGGSIDVPPYPSEFYWDVRKGFQTVLDRYEASVRRVRVRSFWR
ncbi:hypothetical protein [Methylobacterium sp. 22177]|uniref:hypothetical protein n=1 Tax=Methylobacterium sp. 22177 TaxID=3453885 RepID=UPI003F848251